MSNGKYCQTTDKEKEMVTKVFDIETDGLVEAQDDKPEMTRIHIISMLTLETGELQTFHRNALEDNLRDGLDELEQADLIVGHYIIGFDIPAIQKIYPSFSPPEVFDTLVAARVIWTALQEEDLGRIRLGKLPSKYHGKQSLAAWGYRLGNYKGDFEGPWDTWTLEMEKYCEQDVRVTASLYTKIQEKTYPPEALQLEKEVATIIARQERNGFHFDYEGAVRLSRKLNKKRKKLQQKIQKAFPMAISRGKEWVPKRDNKTRGYKAGIKMSKVAFTPLNPSSRTQLADALVCLRGWIPRAKTKDGKPKFDEEIIKGLRNQIPEAKTIEKLLLVEKRIGQLSTGSEAWIKHVQDDRIKGSVNSNGAVTGRMTHSHPNIAQVPRTKTEYGKECRGLFIPRPGWKLVGIDAAGLELRCMAHYLYSYDQGAYAQMILEGDIHQYNTEKAGLTDREKGKRLIYALIYGAGDAKLGEVLEGTTADGAKARETLLREVPALRNLIQDVKIIVNKRKHLRGLDGRHLHIRSEHLALNTLFQSAGALIMKKALVLLDKMLQWMLTPGEDYEFCANVHDEWQIEAKPEYAEIVGDTAILSIVKAGEYFKFNMPLDGEYKIGNSWAETH